MAQKPIAMEQLQQILQLKNDGIGIREMARRTGMSRNSVPKYLSHLDANSDHLSNKELADKAYNNEQLESNIQRELQLLEHFKAGIRACRNRRYTPAALELRFVKETNATEGY